MLLLVDGCFNHSCVEGVWDQTDDKCVLGDLCLKGSSVGDIEGDWQSVRETVSELLRRIEGSAG